MDEAPKLSEWVDPSADVDENRIDLNRLRRNLQLSPEERIERNRQAAIRNIECMRAARSTRLRKPDPIAQS
jgi:hypothetical protein